MKRDYWYIAGGVAALLLIPVLFFKQRIFSLLGSFIPSVEGFRATPYWDENAWRWGYGTPAPGSTGSITRDQAFADMTAYLDNDYSKLKDRVTRSLTAHQWAALLSFSYNVGIGGAYNLLTNINSGNDAALETQFKQYIYSGGSVNPNLVTRRNNEWGLWES